MVIGVLGHHGHHAHEHVAVLYKNHNDFVTVRGMKSTKKSLEISSITSCSRPENGGQYCSGQSTQIRSCENNPVDWNY